MAPPFKIITQEMFLETKLKHLHHWTFLGGQDQARTKKLECRCDICGTRHWVMWRSLCEGTSKRCRGCAKLKVGIEVEDLNAWLQRNGSYWKLTGEFRSAVNGRGEQINRRDAWVICLGCGQGKWNRYEAVAGLKSKSCPPCSQRLWQTGSTEIKKTKTQEPTGECLLPVGLVG